MRLSFFFAFALFCNTAGAQSYKFVVVGAKLYPHKVKGSCWDLCSKAPPSIQKIAKRIAAIKSTNPSQMEASYYAALKGHEATLQGTKMPDPFVVIRFGNGTTLRTQSKPNTILPRWGEAERVRLSPQETIEIHVWDKDLRRNDLIGHLPKQLIPSEYIRSGGTWRVRFGRVFSLDLLIAPEKKTLRYFLRPGHYKVTIVNAKIRYRKTNGKKWDGIGKPDPYAVIRIGHYKLKTHVLMNTFHPKWNYSQNVHINGTERFEYKVIDKDWKLDDKVGLCYKNKIQKITLLPGSLFRESCQQISEITIKFERIQKK